jgi:hypothetical protein
VVVEEPEKLIDSNVHRRRLNHVRVERLENNPLGVYFGTNVAVGDQHMIKNTALAGARTHGPVFPRSRRAPGYGSRGRPRRPPCSAYSAAGISSSTVLSRSSWTTSAFRRHRKTLFTRTRSPLGSHRSANRTRVL